MPSAAFIALDWLDNHRSAPPSDRQRALDAVPAAQWAGPHWAELSKDCGNRIAPEVERRPGNALNLEIGTPQPRCSARSPDGRGLAWILSGGSPLAYGLCSQGECWRAAVVEPKRETGVV